MNRHEDARMFAMKKPLNLAGRFILGMNLEKPGDWRERASNLAEWEAWDRAQRKRFGFFAGLKFWGKTNVSGSRVLLSRHWPHRLCWDWSLWVGMHRGAEFDGPLKVAISIARLYRSIDISLLWFKAHFTWQDYGYMAGLGPAGAGCPKILWKHHLENAEPAGHA